MKTSLVQIVALILGLVLTAAVQDALPALAGVKPPFLTALVLFAAPRLPLPAALAVGAAAGLFGDALTGLAPCCATALLPLLALGGFCARETVRDTPRALVGAFGVGAAAFLGEIWLAVVGGAGGVRLLVRLAVALPLGALVGAALFAFGPFVLWHIGLDDARREVAP